ncbi:Polysaccharide deacetylase [Haloarcula vallismortis]|uniref:Polysaccharide deacetylase n=2 Tax=Haloarcula vallismortis TaxID=28442 RepID=M0IYT3_HALVA|nr:polysaccharide deacetylase family protein [Haloarcula vallismortis]EMA02002.1 polysaccharide deacetylase [Haloarcula vallismortis ATCC 29715]SDW98329.1 Polysaccharide deacetylase [Haloarcula vallismortis]
MTDRAVLSIDFELFTQTPAYRSASGTTDRDGVGLDGGRFFRETLAEYDATATAFVVSAVAESHPDAVRALADSGLEIASHTHTHQLLSALDSEGRREELSRSKNMLERVTDERVSGFRAPAFDITDDHFGLLADIGYTYDSSVVSSRSIPGWYGGEHDVHEPVAASTVHPNAPDTITEFPASVMPGLQLPLTGTWLRFFGPRYTILGMKLLARRGITPMLYVHPWELVDLPAVEGVPTRVYVRTGDWMRRAVERILQQDFEFTTARAVLEDGETAATQRHRGETA